MDRITRNRAGISLRYALSFLIAAEFGWSVRADQAPGTQLHWLEGGAPAMTTGVTWGVPWPEGKYPKDTQFAVRTSSGEGVPVQSWPLATWPDGSL
jgi:hypothetical protein